MTWHGKVIFVLNITLLAYPLGAASLRSEALQRDFANLAGEVSGRVGVCAADAVGQACLNAGQRFPLQSVMKLLVGLAAGAAVDTRALKFDELVIVRREDLSLYVQPIADIVNRQG